MIVVCSKPGQLGNRLFIYATFIAFSKEYQVRVMNVSFDEYSEFFPALNNDIWSRYPPKGSSLKGRMLRHWIFLFFDFLSRLLSRLRINNHVLAVKSLDWNESVDLDSEAFVRLAGTTRLLLLRGWEYRGRNSFSKHADFIRSTFIPAAHHLEQVKNLMKKTRSDGRKVVGIHIRHGDYKTFEGGKYFYDFGQYAEVMRSIQALFPGEAVRFLVCSNVEIDAGAFGDLDIVGGTGHFVEDLYALSQCDCLAGPPSTFTLWASFYGKVPLYMVKDISRKPALADFSISTG